MSSGGHFEGQRLSLKGQTCTVRYVGPVDGKTGPWLGVEWDDTQRGRHNGIHQGRQYFSCRSKSQTAASFLRPAQPWDQPRTFLQALTEKYMSAKSHDTSPDAVYFSGKQAEEVGFSKFSQRQAKLQGIHVLVLERTRIQQTTTNENELPSIAELCADITTLDLSGNLFESFEEVVTLCALLPKLHTLTLNWNRFNAKAAPTKNSLPGVRNLALCGTLFSYEELAHVLPAFPSLEQLEYTENELSEWSYPSLGPSLKTLNLSFNDFSCLSDMTRLEQQCPSLQTLLLQNNKISSAGGENLTFPPTLHELNIAYNAITSWTFFNELHQNTLSIHHLRVTGNPLYTDLHSAEGKPLTASDGYMLTIARLPQLETLNYSAITGKERLNAETYYLGQITVELGYAAAESAEAEILATHPRYRELCEEYGEPVIQRKSSNEEVNPRSLAARLMTLNLQLSRDIGPNKRPQQLEVPKSSDIYAVLGLVGKQLGISPLSLRLTLETGEKDPTARESSFFSPEWWDSSDEGDEDPDAGQKDWLLREVELVPSTRAIATYIEGREASIKVTLKQ